ncbi:MAG: M23 family metallopeptidase [Proteobacteria bacterium]|nr:M23 family metallopeptidase [Pseudomonadota bacterium]
MMHPRTLTACLAALLAAASPSMAGTPNAFNRPAGGGPASYVTPRAEAGASPKAEALVKGLTRRSLVLGQRQRSERGEAARSPRARLASRGVGSTASRQGASLGPARNLAEYLGILDHTTPGGTITGRFSDWRSPSVYRAVGGRHNGYDVALPAGSTVVVGWPGRVSAITRWYGREYGITVISPDGFHTTYGHLAPCVRVGQSLEPGDPVGAIVRDHVDVKMKNAKGQAIDFAQLVPLSSPGERPVASALVNGEPGSESRVFPPLAGPDWTLRREAVNAALGYVKLRSDEASLAAGGSTAPVELLAQVRRDLAAARDRLAVEEVPEEVLLAAFLDNGAITSALTGSDGTATGGANALADWLRRQQTLKDARQAVPQLDQVLADLRD